MKKLLIIAVIIAGVLTGAAYFFNNVLPVRIEQLLKGYVKETLGQEIEIAHIAIHPLKGILLDGVTLYEKGTKVPSLKIARVQTFPFLPSLLTKKKIFLYLGAQNVYCHVKRNEDGTFNVPAFTQQPENGPSFFVNNAEVKNLELDFEDMPVKFRRRFSGINLSANFFVPSDIRYKLSWDKKIALKGKYNLSSGTVKANLTMHGCNLQALNPYIDSFALHSAYVRKAQFTIAGKKSYRINGDAAIENIFIVYPLKHIVSPAAQPTTQSIEAKGNLTVTGGQFNYAKDAFSYRLNATLEKGEFKNLPFIDTVTQTQAIFSLDEKTLRVDSLATKFNDALINLKGNLADFNEPKVYCEGNATIRLPEIIALAQATGGFRFPYATQGDTAIQFVVRGNTRAQEFDYSIEYQLHKAQIDNFENIEATGHIERNTLFVDNAALEYKKVPLTLKGSLKNIGSLTHTEETATAAAQEPLLSLTGELRSSLARFLTCAKDLKIFSFDYAGPGTIDLKFAVRSNAQNKKLSYTGNYQIHDAQWNAFKSFTARGHVENNMLVVKEGSFAYKNVPFTFRGTLEDFAAPRINTVVENGAFSLFGKAHYQKGTTIIEQALLKGKATTISAKGRMQSDKKPFFTMEGSGPVSLEDVREAMKILNMPVPFIEKAAPKGIIHTRFTITDEADAPDWQLKLIGRSDMVKIYNFDFEAVTFDLLKDRERLTISPVQATLAQGKVDVRTKVDFENKKVSLRCVANDIDLRKLKEQLKLKSKNLSGKLSLEAYVENSGLSALHNPTGQGKIMVKEGNIWEINFLKGLGEFLFIPDFEEIQFNEGYSDLVFKDNSVIFENLELNALQMDLKGAGEIALAGTLHFMLFPQFNPDLIAASEGLKKITTNVLGKSGLLIEIEGTLKNPTYTVKPLFLSPMQKIKNFFRELQS